MSPKIPIASSASDQVLSLRVATRFQKLALSDETEEPKRHGRPPPRWREWLDATQNGGKKLVPNPNPDPLSRRRHPQISFNTALKSKAFREKAMQAFQAWLEKTNEEKKGKPQPKGEASGVKETPSARETHEGGTPHGDDSEAPKKKSWADRVKGLGAKAQDFIQKAPKEARRFIEDESFRRQTIQGVHKALVETPEKFAKKAVETVKHEVHEYKTAGEGIASLIRGKKIDKHQKKAIRTVAIHLAIAVSAAALTSSGPLAAAGALVKGMSRHIALKAASRALGHLHVLDEVGHIGHGVGDLMTHLASTGNPQVTLFRYADEASKGGDPPVDDVFGNFISASVAKELENFDDDALEESLGSMDDEGEAEMDSEEEPSGDTNDNGIVKIDLSEVSEIWFVKKDNAGTEKVASSDIISRVVRRYRG